MNRPTNQRMPEKAPPVPSSFGKFMAALAPMLALPGAAFDKAIGHGAAASGAKHTGALSGSQNKVRRMIRRMDPKHRKRALANRGR